MGCPEVGGNGSDTFAECKTEAGEKLQKLKSDIEVSPITPNEVKANGSLLLSTEDIMYSWRLTKKVTSEWNKRNQVSITKIEQLSIPDVVGTLKYLQEEHPDDKKLFDIIRDVENALRTITAPQFAIVYHRVQQEFPGDISHMGVYNIQKDNPGLLVSTEFWDFSQKMCTDFEVERPSLYSDVDLYKKLSNSSELQQPLKETYKSVKQHFTDIPQTTGFLKNLLDSIDSPTDWAKLRQNFDRLQAVYGQSFMQMSSEYNWNELFGNLSNEERIDLLTSDLAMKVWEVTKKYPKLLKEVGKDVNDMFGEHADMKRYIEFFQVIDITPSEFEYLLQLCGLGLTSSSVSLYKSSAENIPKNLDKLLTNGGFQKSTEKLFGILPHLKEGLNFHDWVDLVESFLKNGNLDCILRINQLYQQASIEGVDFRAKDADSKIAALEQMIRLEIPLDQFNFACNKDNPDKCVIGNSTDWSLYLLDEGKAITSPEVSEVISHENFPDFAKKVATHFPQVNWETHIPDIALLFAYVQENPKNKELLFSADFQKICDFLVAEFEFVQAKLLRSSKVDQIPIGAIRKILPIFESFPFEQFKKISETLKLKGEKLVANDILLLLEMVEYPDLLKMVTENRKQTISYITDTLGEGVRRTMFGDIGYRIKQAREKGDLKEIAEAQAVLDNYSERPDIETLPNLEILRIRLIQKSLSDQTFLQDLGRITKSDLADDSALEHGGIITFDNKKIKLQEIATTYEVRKQGNGEEDKASYDSNNYEPMHGGLVHFHLHAISPNQKNFAGPSGYRGLGGDFALAGGRNAPGVVFTPVGYPKDPTGNDVTNKIKMNVDYFFTDERNGNFKQVVVDLGIVDVPLGEK